MRDVTGLEIPRHTLVNALHTAADKYDECARTCRREGNAHGLAQQFRRQADDARRIADLIAEVDNPRILLVD
ncbi:MAG: hypothetical protein J2P55_00030 [Rhizobiales bacterium]|nr:hypothetical protein [Hyphomicrobiales bacterium]